MKYKIEVHSIGYTDHHKIVEVPSMAAAKQGFHVNSAIAEWCDLNDIDIDGNWEFPFTRVTKAS